MSRVCVQTAVHTRSYTDWLDVQVLYELLKIYLMSTRGVSGARLLVYSALYENAICHGSENTLLELLGNVYRPLNVHFGPLGKIVNVNIALFAAK